MFELSDLEETYTKPPIAVTARRLYSTWSYDLTEERLCFDSHYPSMNNNPAEQEIMDILAL